MTTIADIFNELLFGSGFWIGFILITAFAISISYKFQYSGVVFEVVLFLLALEYLDELSVSSNYMWGVILCFVEMIFIGLRLYHDVNAKS